MNPVEFTPEQLKQYFSGRYFHPVHDEVTEAAASLRVHADGIFPHALITERRPHESVNVQAYREKIWKAITKPYFGKVLGSLAKIRRSTEWSVKFDAVTPARIPEDETLEAYLTEQFPRFTSITNWAFSLLLREYAIDANAWVAVMPMDEMVADNEFVRPFPTIFRSEQIIDVEEGLYLVVLSDEKVSYQVGNVTYVDGDRYYIITNTEIQRWDQIDAGRKFGLTWIYEHGIGELPAFQMPGVVIRSNEITVNESRLAPMLPRLDEAVREYSDLQAEVVQHIHSEKWEMGQKECRACSAKGTITVAGFGNVPVTCDTCHGTGWEPRGPYTTMMVSPAMAGESAGPTPPAGYIQKDTNIVEVQDGRVERHIFHALAAVNMEFLAQAPIAESGISKAYDADETNNFVNAVAEDIVKVMDSVAFYTNEMRYSVVLPNPEVRSTMLPEIAVPERFDLFSAQMVEEELSNAKEKKVNPVLINAMELNYATKKFSTEPEVRDRLHLILSLDPMPNISEDDKMMRLQNGGITKETYIISSNIQEFVSRALDEDPKFTDKSLKEQKEVLKGYAVEITNAGSMEKQILSEEVAA